MEPDAVQFGLEGMDFEKLRKLSLKKYFEFDTFYSMRNIPCVSKLAFFIAKNFLENRIVFDQLTHQYAEWFSEYGG